MNKYPYWKTIYFDGFAGSGSRKEVKSSLYKQLEITEEEERIYRGAAERVLSLRDGLSFDFYYFIDKAESSLQKLEIKLSKINSINEKKLVFRSGDANQWILKLADTLKTNKYAALVFLDPFGMQIDWDSIAALRDTRSDI